MSDRLLDAIGEELWDLLVGETFVDDLAKKIATKVRALLGDGHFVVFTADRWTVEHSIDCRLSGVMHECEYHAAIERIADDMQDSPGRYRITDLDEGLPSLEVAPAFPHNEEQPK